MDRFIIVKKTEDGRGFRYMMESSCLKQAERDCAKQDPFELEKVFKQKREHVIVRDLMYHYLQTRKLVSQLEDVEGIECTSIMDTVEILCSERDSAPLETSYEELEELLNHIRNFGTIEEEE